MYSGSNKHRGAYFGSRGAYTPSPSRTSSTISVIGRRPAPASVEEDRCTTVVPPKRMRLSRQQLSAMQKRDMQRDEALLKSQLTRSQLADLAEFQQELGAGTGIIYGDILNDTENNPNNDCSESSSVHDDDNDDAWEDEVAAVEEFGISSTSHTARKRSEWSDRIMDEHADWLEQLSELADAYLEYRSAGPPSTPVDVDANIFSLHCLSLETEEIMCFERTATYANATLLRNGFIAPSPRHPTLAFSLLVLDVLVAFQRRGPSVSIQTMAKALCDLRNRIKEMRFDMCLGSFHGPAHNRLCQLRNHPHNREGTGLSPLENAEQIFSSSNRIASLVRLASKYHRQQRIHIHFDAWDEDQHQNLGYLLRTKYIHALGEHRAAESTIAKLKPGVLAANLEGYIEQEKAYLESLRAPLVSETFAVEYLDLLEKLEAKHATNGPLTNNLRQSTIKTAKIETRRRNTFEQLLTIQDAVAKLEEKHNITHRWTRTSKEWIEAQKTQNYQRYYAAVDELERLVVQRLFELSRAGLANTGYKLRQHILKAVYVQSKAVRVALDRYNKLASQLVPPARTISWDSITNAKVLDDFDILRGSRWGIEEEEWSKPENRRCAEQARQLKRAEEEIQRLNVEVQRVWTLIVDEARSLPQAVSKIASQDSGLGWAARRYVDRRLKANQLVSAQLKKLEMMRSFSGNRNIGVRVGNTNDHGSGARTNAVLPADHEAHDIIGIINSQEPAELSDSDSNEETTSEQVDKWQSMINVSRSM
ncbi:hypothetical protein BN14_09661 [Rhizoctonia solani AG-1 IB]|uniref:Uncharacterized protein n=1 Tax=Thanatephorus cucumeris (strain AG1-IB / isolate 7/3/14) TaxID=1108050 RepID=M5C6G7_THACB|nr:hypothetical protein BN14_09661 [Rhizoctonia solani AG-1 IB]